MLVLNVCRSFNHCIGRSCNKSEIFSWLIMSKELCLIFSTIESTLTNNQLIYILQFMDATTNKNTASRTDLSILTTHSEK